MKGYLSSLLQVRNQDPYSFIPTTMRSTNSANYVSAGAVQYDFSKDTAVSSIRYGGFGQQWQMVMDNIAQSELFYAALKIADSAITASAIKLNNRFDEDPTETQAEATESSYTANVSYASDVLSYTIKLKQGKNVSGLGTVQPQIDMIYNIKTGERAVRIHISDTNAMRYVVTDTEYTFAIQYGASSANRTAYCNLKKKGSGSEGHIYEYITVKGKDAVKSCADFYIDGTYTSVVGNKANGIIGMDGYINELYKTSEGKLLGYKVQETKTVFGITGTYHTLWFNLSDIKGISSVRVTEHTDDNKNDLNANNVYVNGSSALFTPTYNKKLVVKTSRKYDIELRTQYFYGKDGSDFTCYETKIPMMFIQDDHDDYTNYSDFPSDIKSENKISASVSLSNQILSKIRSDYDTLIPVFKENKARFSSNEIVSFIGTPAK